MNVCDEVKVIVNFEKDMNRRYQVVSKYSLNIHIIWAKVVTEIKSLKFYSIKKRPAEVLISLLLREISFE